MRKEYSNLRRVREFLKERGCFSQTSEKYQDDILESVINFINAGDCIIEVGIYKGGLSSQLAYILENTGRTLILLDVSDNYLNEVKKLIQHDLEINTDVLYINSTLESFVDKYKHITPAFVIIDANHEYDWGKKDIRAIKNFVNQPPLVAFHDFSLRYTNGPFALNVRMDLAIIEEYLDLGYKYQEIGLFKRESNIGCIGNISTESKYYYHDSKHSEGMIVVTDEIAFKQSAPWLWKDLKIFPLLYSPGAKIDSAILQIEDFIQLGNITYAEKLVLRILNKQPENVHALNCQAVINLLRDNLSNALQILSRILELDPENESALANMYVVKDHLNNLKESDSKKNKIAEVNPAGETQ